VPRAIVGPRSFVASTSGGLNRKNQALYHNILYRLARIWGYLEEPEVRQRLEDDWPAQAPQRMRVFEYGESWEGRKMIYGEISDPKNIARLEEIKSAMTRLADPRRLRPGKTASITQSMPAVVWLSHSVHGNEPGTTDAAMLTAYHLLASRNGVSLICRPTTELPPIRAASRRCRANASDTSRPVICTSRARSRWADGAAAWIQ